jgi:hypothetical protein
VSSPRASRRDGLDLQPRLEDLNLAALRLRVADLRRDVLVDVAAGDGVVEDLPHRLRDVPGGTRRQSLAPGGELRNMEAIEANVAEGGRGVPQSRLARCERVLLGDVLREELVDEFPKGQVTSCERTETNAVEDALERIRGLGGDGARAGFTAGPVEGRSGGP